MAVSIDTSAQNSSTGAGSATISVSLTVADHRDRYLIVFIGASDATSIVDVTGVTWNTSENLGELFDVTSGTFDRIWCYGVKNPTATTANATVTFASTTNDQIYIIAVSLYGVDQTTPTGTARTSTTAIASNNVWVSCDGGQAGGIVIGMGHRDITSSGTPSLADVNGIPEYIAAGALSAATAQTSRTPAAPSGATYGDLEIATCVSENNATHSVSGSGWVKIGQTDSGASYTCSHFYRIHNGTNVDPVISWSGSADAAARRFLFRDTKATGTPTAYIGTVGTGTTSPHTSTGGNTTEADVLAVYIDFCNANTAMAAETGWTERVDSGSATGPVRSYLADQEIATAGTSTGNVSEAGGVAAYVQQQFEVYNSDVGDQINLQGINSLGGFASVDVSYEPCDTYNALGWNGSGGTTEAVAAGAIPINPSKSLPPFNRPTRFMPRRAA